MKIKLLFFFLSKQNVILFFDLIFHLRFAAILPLIGRGGLDAIPPLPGRATKLLLLLLPYAFSNVAVVLIIG